MYQVSLYGNIQRYGQMLTLGLFNSVYSVPCLNDECVSSIL